MSPEPDSSSVTKKVPDEVDVANAPDTQTKYELSVQMLKNKLVHQGPDILHWRSHKAAQKAEHRWDLEREK